MIKHISILFILILSISSRRNPFREIKIEREEFLYPIFYEIENHQIELKFRTLMKGHLFYDVKQTSNIGDILHEFYRMSSNDLHTPVDALTEEYLTILVRNLFTEQKYNLQAAVTKPAKINQLESTIVVNLPPRKPSDFKIREDYFGKAFYEFGKNYVIKVIQKKLDQMANKDTVKFEIERLVTDKVFAEGFELFIQAHQISLNRKDHDQILDQAKVIFNDSIKETEEFVLNFLIWKAEASTNEYKFVNFLIKHTTDAKYDPHDLAYEYNLMVTKLLIVVDFYRRISFEQQSYDLIYFIGQNYLQKNHQWSSRNSLFTTILIEQMMKLFLKTSDFENLKKGKEIFVSYFTEFSSYSKPTPAYKKFIQNRYKRRGINFTLNDLKEEYQRMNRLQIIDILHCSIFMEKELLSRNDIYTIFSSFNMYANNFDHVEHQIFVHLRNMMISAGQTVNDLPVFFDSLYGSFLQATQYYSYVERERLGVYINPPTVYNDYIDYIWKRRNGLWKYVAWIWLPDFVHFPYNINENYAFFKIINLATNVDSLTKQGTGFEFCNFQYQNNYWIHKYTTTPTARRLINFIRIHKLTDQVFNYKILAGQTLEWELLVKLGKYIKNEDQEL